MREFAVKVDVKKGMRPYRNVPKNSPFAYDLLNVRCGEAGLEVPPYLHNITPDLDCPWPYCQVVKVGTRMTTSSGIYVIHGDNNSLNIYNFSPPMTLIPAFIKDGGATRVAVADFGHYQVWCGTHRLILLEVVYHESEDAYLWRELTINGYPPAVYTVCNFRGQLVAGFLMFWQEPLEGHTQDYVIGWGPIGGVIPTTMFDPAYYYVGRSGLRGAMLISELGLYTETSGPDDGYYCHVISSGSKAVYYSYNYLAFGNTANGDEIYHTWVKFNNVTIPQGATIKSAKVRFVAYENESGSHTLSIRAGNVDNAYYITSASEYDSYPKTSGIAWNLTEDWYIGQQYDTPDIKDIIQAVVNRAGWESGNNMIIFVEENGSSTHALRNPRASEYSAGYESHLIVEYEYYGEGSQPYSKVDITAGNIRIGNSQPRRILPLGNGVMVYTSNRIFYLKAHNSPVTTFGMIPLLDVGIPFPSCVDGNEYEHVFVDNDFELWVVRDGEMPKKLGYREYVDSLGGEIVVSRDELRGDYYIGGGNLSYGSLLLSKNGMSRVSERPGGLALLGYELYTCMTTPGGGGV